MAPGLRAGRDMKHILALSVGPPGQGSAIAILERKPQKGERTEEWCEHGPIVRQEWIDHHTLRFLERVSPGESIPAAAVRVRKMLTSPGLALDTDLVLDVTTYGRGLTEMFESLEPSPPERRMVVGGEAEAPGALGGWTVPERDVRGALTLHTQEGRLTVAAGLPLGPSLLRAIENPDATPDRDIYLAAALGVWIGRRCQTYGPWPSSKPAPRGSVEAVELEEMAINERREQRRHEHEEMTWRHGYGMETSGGSERAGASRGRRERRYCARACHLEDSLPMGRKRSRQRSEAPSSSSLGPCQARAARTRRTRRAVPRRRRPNCRRSLESASAARWIGRSCRRARSPGLA